MTKITELLALYTNSSLQIKLLLTLSFCLKYKNNFAIIIYLLYQTKIKILTHIIIPNQFGEILNKIVTIHPTLWLCVIVSIIHILRKNNTIQTALSINQFKVNIFYTSFLTSLLGA